MPLNVIVRIQVQNAISNLPDEYDFEVSITMPLAVIKTEIIEAMGWKKPGLNWDLRIPSRPDALMDDTLETLRCWDDTVIVLRSLSVDNDILPDHESNPGRAGYQVDS